ncbi:cytochrome c maturation protein CcmE [Methylomonas fluvii]|uniref:Cytochrome c-type biogenesis protein CcmE n=1 Tax=Methylomonas fluvii TaxID=1854564 RepID=A0ABR9DHU0_9GAMM|nr:cytochrome c maturation protein CcmE [Methylomonas fluvii]MBD9362670.1 cytochrome c maturation protein CcmE [Methylomonas fluvii]CAD6875796.1 Cytochrome c-type biogenesis protein CcmE, heme chaperone [Methylomonas fluvii]
MKPIRKQRLFLIILMLAGLGLAATFALKAFNENLMYFFSTSDVAAGKAPSNAVFRLGGMVVKGSVERPNADLLVRFKLSDFEKEVTVEYSGILPDLFREGQGIVAKGALDGRGVFVAEEVLAKHDENYMPPEVAGSLKKPAAKQ